MSLLVTLALAADAPLAPLRPAPSPITEAAPADAAVPFRLVLVPGVGLAAAPDAAVHGSSFGVYAHAAAVRGLDAQLLGTWVDGEVDGVQAALGLAVAGEVRGAQLSSGVNWSRGDVAFAQLSAGANVAEGAVRGVQGSAGVNVAAAVDGMQAAPVNVARAVSGAQLGLVNVGGDARGLQLGLVNVARTSGVSLGLVNLIGDGLHRVDVWASESSVGNVGIKLGSKQVYTLVGAGWVGLEQDFWTFGGGMGVHLGRDRLWVEVDDSVWGIADGVRLAPGIHNKLRIQAGVALHEHLQPFAGVSLNHWIGTGAVWPSAQDLPARITPDKRLAAWPGVHAGISF